MADSVLVPSAVPERTLASKFGIQDAVSLASCTRRGGAMMSASTARVTAPPVFRTIDPIPAPKTPPAAPVVGEGAVRLLPAAPVPGRPARSCNSNLIPTDPPPGSLDLTGELDFRS